MTEQRSSQFVAIHTVSNRFEADLLTDALEKEKIPFILRSFEETPYNGLFVKQRGWGCLMVLDDLALDARRVIQPLIEETQSQGPYDDPSEVDPLLWEKLREADPKSVGLNGQIRHDAERIAYIIPFLDIELLCSPERESIEPLTCNLYHKLGFESYLITLHYLLEAQPVGLAGKWISEKDIPGGELFFRGPHKFPTDRLIDLFGSRLDLFASASERLGGMKVNMGDLAYRFWPFPRVPVLFVLWEGDEEFEPSLQIRFDGSINVHLRTLDTIWAMVNVVCRSLYVAGKSLREGPE
jgi:hypothetical protein